jgi:ABC-2 type transport system permease protein
MTMPIFDQGYQHWKGTLSGHAWRWLAITKQGLRGQFKNRSVRIVLLLAWLPPLALVLAMTLWGLLEQGSDWVLEAVRHMLPPGVVADPRTYREAIWTIAYSTFFKFEIFFIMLLMVIAGPNLISRDLRFNALPLYFSRPLGRLDYFFGKLGVIAALVAMVAVAPAIAAYLLGACFSLDLGMVRDTWRLLPASIAYGLVIVVSAGSLMLALSSLSRRSLYVGIAWGGLWVISSAVAGVLAGIQRDTIARPVWQEQNAQAISARRPTNYNMVQGRVEQALAEEAPTNWRPLCSYTANLERLGEALLGTDAAWVQIGRAIEAPRAALQPFLALKGAKQTPMNERRLADQMVPQYPWIWSAGVLAGLLGLSLWTLSTRVKSLDRLR